MLECSGALRTSTRSRSPAARAVGVSDDGRHVLVAAGGGFIFRQEARPVEGEESGGGKENEGGGD